MLLQPGVSYEYAVQALLQRVVVEHSFCSASDLVKEILGALLPALPGGLLLEGEQVLSHDARNVPDNLHCLKYSCNVIHLGGCAAPP